MALYVLFFVRGFQKVGNAMCKEKAKMELRQRRLRELLAALDVRE